MNLKDCDKMNSKSKVDSLLQSGFHNTGVAQVKFAHIRVKRIKVLK